jgi:hypothetical protein
MPRGRVGPQSSESEEIQGTSTPPRRVYFWQRPEYFMSLTEANRSAKSDNKSWQSPPFR